MKSIDRGYYIECNVCGGRIYELENSRRIERNIPQRVKRIHLVCPPPRSTKRRFPELTSLTQNRHSQTPYQERCRGYIIAYRCNREPIQALVRTKPEGYYRCPTCGRRHRFRIIQEVWE